METPHESETGCCPRFDPEPWDEKEHTWQDRLFIRDHVPCVFYMPLGFGRVMVRNMEKIDRAQAQPPAPLLLSDCVSPWRSDIYIEVARDVPDATMTRLSGTFLTKVFEGPYKKTRQWVGQMKQFLESRGKPLQKLYFYYTTCPKCAKAYGKNYVVLVAQVG